jgi:nucleoside-diphosphate-sugar epimerase
VTKALITGGAGFIGSNVARRLLDNGYAVDLLDDFSRGVNHAASVLRRAGDVRLLEYDLREPEVLEAVGDEYSHIVHLAAIVGVANVVRKPYEVLRGNVAMTENALALARRQSRLRRFLFASTSEVYAGTLEHFTLPIPTPEATPLALPSLSRPRTTYMLSKLYGEAMCHQAIVPFTIVRPHNVYGPRMGLAHVIPELLERAHAARDGRLEVFSPDHKRTFCYVDDAVEMMVRALEAPECDGMTLNIGNDRPEVTIRALAQLVVEVVGRDLEIVPGPTTPGSPARRCPDMSTTQALTGYRSRVTLEEGIRRTYDAYRSEVFERPAASTA